MKKSRPRQADNVIFREIDDEIVLLKDDGLVLHILNKTAARIWEMCDGNLNQDEIAVRLCERFDVSPERARADVSKVLAEMKEKGLLEPPDQETV